MARLVVRPTDLADADVDEDQVGTLDHVHAR
jgi:hypothetical protein